MATTYIALPANSGWVLTAGEGTLIQNTQGSVLHVTVQAAAPAASAAYHELRRGEALEVVGTGDAYIRNPEGHSVNVPVTT